MNRLDELKTNRKMFFNFMKSKYPVHFKSNIFLRDLQYAIYNYFNQKGAQLGYSETERLAKALSEFLVEKNELTRLNNNSWKVNFSI